MNTERLYDRLRSAYGESKGLTLRFGRGRSTMIGLERRENPSDYHWDGLLRGGRAEAPFFIFQYTLDGFGIFEQGGKSHRIEAGRSFVAVVPSAHRYYLPADSPGWTFVWFLLPHPYIVRRMTDRLAGTDCVQAFDPAGAV